MPDASSIPQNIDLDISEQACSGAGQSTELEAFPTLKLIYS